MTTHLHELVDPALSKVISAAEAIPAGGLVAFSPQVKAVLYTLAKEAYRAGAEDTVANATAPAVAVEPPAPVAEPDPAPAPELEPATPTE